MPSFQFAQILVKKRQQLQLTQEDIASYVGVTRAAVSKWEKGLSYPDISLLPKLATFFNMSIDALLGYEPQMTTERIEKLYMEYAQKFATEDFEKVYEQLNQTKQEYYSCYPLLLKIVQLYINYLSKAPNKEAILQEAFEIAERVRSLADQISIVKEAISIQAVIYIMQGDGEAVLNLIGREPELDYGTEQLMITAHSMQGNIDNAKEIAQVAMYQKLIGLLTTSTESLLLSLDQPSHFEETVGRVEKLFEVYNVESLHVNTALVFYLKAAVGYVMLQQPNKAIEMLGKYVNICEKIIFPLKLQGDNYFYLLTNWIERQPQLMMQAPRDEASIKKDIVQTLANPAFDLLKGEKAYEVLVQRLKNLQEE